MSDTDSRETVLHNHARRKRWSKEQPPTMRIVLLGTNASGNSRVGNFLLGRAAFETEEPPDVVERVGGKHMTVIKSPNISLHQMTQTVRECVSLSAPGPHVILLVLKHDQCSREEKECVEMLLNSFSHTVYQHTMMITTHESHTQVNDIIQEIIHKCNDRHFRLERNNTAAQLMEKCEEIVHSNGGQHLICKETDSSDCGLRIVLIGKTGSGKSETGNTILSSEEFYSELSTDSVTSVCKKGVGEVDGKSIAVIDTPGLFDTSLSNEQVLEEILKCITMSAPGPHAFIIALSLGRTTKEEMETVDLIKKVFGPKAAQFSIVLFTRGDDLGKTSIEQYVEKSKSAELKKMIRDCGNRYLVFNNKERQDRSQVTKLLNMIEEIKNSHQGQYFTNEMFEEAEMSIKKRMEEILKEKEKEIQAQKEELKVQYEMDLKKRLEEEKRRADEKRVQMENKFREKEETVRKEFEEKEEAEKKKREMEDQKRSEEEKQQKAEYNKNIEEMKREIENQKSQYEKQQKEREEEDRKKEEKYKQDQEKIKNKQARAIEELKKRQEEERIKRDSEERKRSEQEEKERKEWERKIKEAENDRKETQEEMKQQQREWEDEKKRQMREREEEERKRRERHEEQLREKQEELENMRKKFDTEREEERQKREDERQQERREREQKEREYEQMKDEMKRQYEQLERKMKEEWERRKREDDERREEERKRWEKMIEDLKQERETEIKRRDKEERERRQREVKDCDAMKNEIQKFTKKIFEQNEEFVHYKYTKEQQVQSLNKMLEGYKAHNELLEKLQQSITENNVEVRNRLQKEIDELKKQSCAIQ